jgi:hypothetical protein
MRGLLPTLAFLTLLACATPIRPVANEREFTRWAAADGARAEAFARFRQMLDREGVGAVVPVYDLWIVDRLRAECMHEPFTVPPEEEWGRIVPTLRFVRDYVEPVVGDVRVVSAYRDQAFNECVGGAPASAHRGFVAVDLVPVASDVSREDLIETLCALHTREGPTHGVGLGIYTARRFHIDTRSYRGWGADHHAATFPCNAPPG